MSEAPYADPFAEGDEEQYEVQTSPWFKFAEPGDAVWGRVDEYNPDSGATTYDDEPCGYINLRQPDGTVYRIGLDKNALRDKVVASRPVVGRKMKILFSEMRDSKRGGQPWKFFKVCLLYTSPSPRD